MRLADYIEQKPVLETERLRLRPMTAADVAALRAWTADKSLYRYWGKSAGKADKDPSLLFLNAARPTKSFHWGVAETGSDRVIGELWVYLIENDRMAKVALRMAPAAQGKGLGTEALRRAVQFCFTQTELQRLWSDVDVRNAASCRIMEKCGFTREGMIRQGKMVSAWCDYYLYGMLKEDYLRAT